MSLFANQQLFEIREIGTEKPVSEEIEQCQTTQPTNKTHQLFPTTLIKITSPSKRIPVFKKAKSKNAEKCKRWRLRKIAAGKAVVQQHGTEVLPNKKNGTDQEQPPSVTSSLVSKLDEVIINKSSSLPLYNHFELRKAMSNAERCRKYKQRKNALKASIPMMSTECVRKQKPVKVELVLKKVANQNPSPSDDLLNPEMCSVIPGPSIESVRACDNLDISRSFIPAKRRAMTNAERCRKYRLRRKALKEGVPMTSTKCVPKNKGAKVDLVLKKVPNENPSSSGALLNPDTCAVNIGPPMESFRAIDNLDTSRSLITSSSIADKVKANPCASSLTPGKQKDVKLVFIKVAKQNPSASCASLNSDNSAVIPGPSIELVNATDNVDISRSFKPAFKRAKTNAEKCRQYKLRKKAAEAAKAQKEKLQ